MNMVMNVPKRHPSADRPLVDWDLILIMEPLTIGGALAGSFLNKILPEWLLVICLVLLLTYTAQSTLKKGLRVYQIESQAMAQARYVSSFCSSVSACRVFCFVFTYDILSYDLYSILTMPCDAPVPQPTPVKATKGLGSRGKKL